MFCSCFKKLNQKQLLADVLKNMCSSKFFRNNQRKTPVLESLFNKVGGLQFSCEYCEIFKNNFFHKTPPVAASEISNKNISSKA